MNWQTDQRNCAADADRVAARLFPGWLLTQADEGFGLPLFGALFSAPALDDEERAAFETEGIYSTRVSP
jgi:hypothetical protein